MAKEFIGVRDSEVAYGSPQRDLHTPAKRAFFRIAKRWGLTDGEARILLGNPGRTTFYAYKKGQGSDLSHDTLSRISYVLGIYKALELLFPNPEQADAWMKKPNRVFGGRSALEHALGGQITDLAHIRNYLDYVRGEGA